MSKYIKFGGHFLSKDKIVQVTARNSFMYLRYPFIMDIKYAKMNKTTSYINIGKEASFSIPVEDTHSSMDFQCKYMEKAHIEEDLELFRECPNAEIRNTIGPRRGQ